MRSECAHCGATAQALPISPGKRRHRQLVPLRTADVPRVVSVRTESVRALWCNLTPRLISPGKCRPRRPVPLRTADVPRVVSVRTEVQAHRPSSQSTQVAPCAIAHSIAIAPFTSPCAHCGATSHPVSSAQASADRGALCHCAQLMCLA
ncbi:hypothetical protein NDU88_007085 [Pleurodeles waltl]|uniref:Uncharacterized protein n=1 Tax=Pleurodeles waltl TaxID=8319 RepID=A0AAV7LSM0_PLEWA|nr:hypothetical protein NDU88_007085 [Pleurodeles waltl]